jgi:hypothetical protein
MREGITTHCLVIHHMTGYIVFVLVSTECVMMCPEIDELSSCEIRACYPLSSL